MELKNVFMSRSIAVFLWLFYSLVFSECGLMYSDLFHITLTMIYGIYLSYLLNTFCTSFLLDKNFLEKY